MEHLRIDIWSDIACPYCYIGKKKLEKVLNDFSDRVIPELVWHSFELNPRLSGISKYKSYYEYLSRKPGNSEEEAKRKAEEVKKAAGQVGLVYDFDKLVVANTFDALRLVKLAAGYSVATEMEELLFRAYFTEGKDINDHSVLVGLGEKAGLKSDEIIAMLTGELFARDVREDHHYVLREFKIEYIPFYIFNEKHILQGDISEEEYKSTIQTVLFGQPDINDLSFPQGPSCSIDGCCS